MKSMITGLEPHEEEPLSGCNAEGFGAQREDAREERREGDQPSSTIVARKTPTSSEISDLLADTPTDGSDQAERLRAVVGNRSRVYDFISRADSTESVAAGSLGFAFGADETDVLAPSADILAAPASFVPPEPLSADALIARMGPVASQPAWLLWGVPGAEKPKLPHYARGGVRRAHGTESDLSQLVTLSEALAAAGARGAAGVGLVMHPNFQHYAFDLDKVLPGGANHGRHEALIASLLQARAYVEVSPGGLGLRAIFVTGPGESLPHTLAGASGLELFGDSKYVTVTGRALTSHDVSVADPELFRRYLKAHGAAASASESAAAAAARADASDDSGPFEAASLSRAIIEAVVAYRLGLLHDDDEGTDVLAEGGRNVALHHELSYLRGQLGFSRQALNFAGTLFGEACEPYLEESEVASIAHSAAGYSPPGRHTAALAWRSLVNRGVVSVGQVDACVRIRLVPKTGLYDVVAKWRLLANELDAREPSHVLAAVDALKLAALGSPSARTELITWLARERVPAASALSAWDEGEPDQAMTYDQLAYMADTETLRREHARYSSSGQDQDFIEGSDAEDAELELFPPELWENYLVKDLTVMSAPGDQGKTTFVIDQLIRGALGLPALGRACRGALSSVYVTAEDSARRLRARRDRAMSDMCLTPAQREQVRQRFWFVDAAAVEDHALAEGTRSGFRRGRYADRLLRQLQERAWDPEAPLGLVVFDPISSFISGAGSEDKDAFQALVEAGRYLMRYLNAGVLYLHHTTKESRKGQGSRLADDTNTRGSSALVDGARVTLLLQSVSKGSELWARCPPEFIAAAEQAGEPLLYIHHGRGQSIRASRRVEAFLHRIRLPGAKRETGFAFSYSLPLGDDLAAALAEATAAKRVIADGDVVADYLKDFYKRVADGTLRATGLPTSVRLQELVKTQHNPWPAAGKGKWSATRVRQVIETAISNGQILRLPVAGAGKNASLLAPAIVLRDAVVKGHLQLAATYISGPGAQVEFDPVDDE